MKYITLCLLISCSVFANDLSDHIKKDLLENLNRCEDDRSCLDIEMHKITDISCDFSKGDCSFLIEIKRPYQTLSSNQTIQNKIIEDMLATTVVTPTQMHGYELLHHKRKCTISGGGYTNVTSFYNPTPDHQGPLSPHFRKDAFSCKERIYRDLEAITQRISISSRFYFCRGDTLQVEVFSDTQPANTSRFYSEENAYQALKTFIVSQNLSYDGSYFFNLGELFNLSTASAECSHALLELATEWHVLIVGVDNGAAIRFTPKRRGNESLTTNMTILRD